MRGSTMPAAIAAVTRDERALPLGAMWFFVAGPPVMALLFDPECIKEPMHVARAMSALVTYTVITGVSVHFAFEWTHARLKDAPVALRLTMHATITAVVVVVVSLPQLPFVGFVYPEVAGDEATVVLRGVLVSYAYLAVASFIGHLQRQAARERNRAQEERMMALESRLRVLQAQTQPHFLFNSLNVCAGLVHQDADGAERTLDRLSGFLRYSLESTERRLVPLGEELEAVRDYLEVQRQRFGDRLEYEVRSEPVVCRVPPMLLQPLVENAVLHGIQRVPRGGVVTVDARRKGDVLSITISDVRGGPRGDDVGHRGTGMGQRNVRERLALVYGEEARLDVGPTDDGYRSEITIPVGS
jgi:two-component system sensor histidine kinase AlgZ